MKKTKTLAGSIVVRVFAVLLVFSVITTITLGSFLNSHMSAKQDEYLHSIQDNIANQADSFVYNFEMVTKLLASDEELIEAVSNSTIENPFSEQEAFDRIISYASEAHSNYDEILNFAVGVYSENTAYIQTGERVGGGFSLRDREIYRIANDGQETTTNPYIDAVTGEMCISIVAPIVGENNQNVGLVALDLSMAKLSNILEENDFSESGVAMIFSNNNIVVAHSDATQTGLEDEDMDVEGEVFFEEIDNPTRKIIKYENGGEAKVGTVVHVSDYWKVLIEISQKEYNADTFQALAILVLFFIANTIAVTIVLVITIKRKLKFVSNITSSLDGISNGNLNVDIEYNADDEFGEMVTSLKLSSDKLISYITEIDDVMQKLASSDLSAKVYGDFPGDFSPIKNSISIFTVHLSDLLHNISDVSLKLLTSASQVSSGSQVLAKGTSEQGLAIEELTATINEISAHIQKSASEARGAHIEMEHSRSSLDLCSEQMKTLETAMGGINEMSIQISGIIKTIEDIAFQTNILALNAAVEAARAGNAGKGFAVVANEVRDLASKSSSASTAISNLITESMKTVNKGMDATKQTSQSLVDVVSKTKATSVRVDQIFEDSKYQEKAIKEVIIGVEQITSVINTNLSTAEQSADASKELFALSQSLKGTVNKFNFDKKEINYQKSVANNAYNSEPKKALGETMNKFMIEEKPFERQDFFRNDKY